jgi:hypothetical protein
MMVGTNVVQGNSINVNGDNSDGIYRKDLYVFWDASKKANTVTDDADYAGTFYESSTGYSSVWTTDIMYSGGVLHPMGSGANSSTGTGDYMWVSATNPTETLSFGYSNYGAYGGAWYVSAYGALSLSDWNCGARLSGLGLSAKPTGGEA